MKLNFGHGIFIFYAFFVTALGYQVYKSTTIDHSLVAANYYEQDITYQKTLDARTRGTNMPVVLQQVADGSLELRFMGDFIPAQAQLHLMRPDSKVDDVSVELNHVQPQMTVVDSGLLPGRWRARLDWQSADNQRVVKDYNLYLK
jgi:nitrogen fixation protein FixH